MILDDKGDITTESSSPRMTTHCVDILAFIDAQQISCLHFETPYHLSPPPGGEKIYRLLRETLDRAGKIGIARIMINARPQLAVLVPCGPKLILKTLRWSGEGHVPEIAGELAGWPSASMAEDTHHDDQGTGSYHFEQAFPRLRCIAAARDGIARRRPRNGRPARTR